MIPRWLQIPVGIVLGLFSLLCLLGTATLLIAPPDKNPLLGIVVGMLLAFGCLWVLQICIRLVTGRKRHEGLMAPRSLRLIAYLFLLLPVGGLFTGYFQSHPLVATLQTLAYTGIFFGLRRRAAWRERFKDAAACRDEL